MSELTPLTPTATLPAKDFMEHEGGLLVRCPLNGAWVPLSNYYSEQYGSLLPLVGEVDYEGNSEVWEDSGEKTALGETLMVKKQVEAPLKWKEVVRVLAPVEEAEPEGGTIQMQTGEDVGTKESF